LGRAPGAVKPGADFSKALDSALKSVSQMQQESSSLQRQYQLGADKVSLEDTMVAMQKAQVGFQAALTVRNRLVSAYTDIMNIQV
jgi:flagellar hook-basal body complex protein FliE